MASNAVDPREPPRIKDMVHRPTIDTAPPPPECEEHPDAKQRRVLRATWICTACVRDRAGS
ncbi:hypothetical protein [Streptomyces sp. 6N223]|uniref:hypothetical protein n=1 Tax=Streptomyces sp. 6N223 TaxID=3457412 RepID=UPI003FD52825